MRYRLEMQFAIEHTFDDKIGIYPWKDSVYWDLKQHVVAAVMDEMNAWTSHGPGSGNADYLQQLWHNGNFDPYCGDFFPVLLSRICFECKECLNNQREPSSELLSVMKETAFIKAPSNSQTPHPRAQSAGFYRQASANVTGHRTQSAGFYKSTPASSPYSLHSHSFYERRAPTEFNNGLDTSCTVHDSHPIEVPSVNGMSGNKRTKISEDGEIGEIE